MDFVSTAAAIGSIVLVNLVLSGDNAVVIALAARRLPPHLQTKAIVWGSAAAILLRIGLTAIAAQLLEVPFLKTVGALLLLYIGIRLLVDDAGEDESSRQAGSDLATAIRTILVADLVMSLDNVIAVAAAAKGDWSLLVVGLALSIPLIVFGSRLLMRLMERFPWIVDCGAALLGWLAGEMATSDPGTGAWLGDPSMTGKVIASAAGAVLVLAAARFLKRLR